MNDADGWFCHWCDKEVPDSFDGYQSKWSENCFCSRACVLEWEEAQ